MLVSTTTVLRPFPGPPGSAGARRELLDFMVQQQINRGRHTDHPAGRHSIWTNRCPPPSPIFYGLHALPAAQSTMSKHRRQSTEGELVSNGSEKFSLVHNLHGSNLYTAVMYRTYNKQHTSQTGVYLSWTKLDNTTTGT